jgi:hypothetical protein
MIREALEAVAAKERFWKLQEAGKTDQAKADLARLAIIRKEREEKAKQRQVSYSYLYFPTILIFLGGSRSKGRGSKGEI